jgi:hypothetical protein
VAGLIQRAPARKALAAKLMEVPPDPLEVGDRGKHLDYIVLFELGQRGPPSRTPMRYDRTASFAERLGFTRYGLPQIVGLLTLTAPAGIRQPFLRDSWIRTGFLTACTSPVSGLLLLSMLIPF